ncbi:helix-turn-helix domain-containing protein [Streptosporangium sp. NPDC048865]|uniref:helix-turn-helix domain-containing protein n=1 Tax=Streptosporangium sp. NPDC048865 TaxID=3155766 RepID=UPI00344A6093
MSAASPEQSLPLEALLTPEEVAPLFKVQPSTIKTWARLRKMPSTKTPGGEIRVRTSDVAAMLSADAAS